jgi:hypothetical protein
MRWDSFARSVGFAAVAALAVPAAFALAGPYIGVAATWKLAGVAAATLYVLGLAPDRPRRARVAVVASALGLLLLGLPLGVAATLTGAAAIVAVCRSGLIYRSRPSRGLAIEALLGGAGLATASFLATGSVASFALAVWGYFLVQSGFFLIGGVASRTDPAAIDPFERARRQLDALLENGSG